MRKGFSTKIRYRSNGIGGNSRVLEWCREYGKLQYSVPGTQIGRPMKDPQKQRIKELATQLKEAQ